MTHLPDQSSRNGLIRAIDPQTARRQLHMSLGVLGVLVVAAGAGLTLRHAPTAHAQASLTVQAPQIVHMQHARYMPRAVAGE